MNAYQSDIVHEQEHIIAQPGDTYLQDKLHILRKERRYYEHDTNDIGVNTDEYLLNQKLNELFNKEKKKIEDDNIKYEQIEQTKPFQCSICGENFSIETNLKEHMLQHTKILTEEEMDEEKQGE